MSVAAQEISYSKNTSSANELAPIFMNSWNLVELNGLSTLQTGLRQPYITFQNGEFNFNRMVGFTGCNYMVGRIDLLEKNAIHFHPQFVTNENCAGGSVEAPLLDVMMSADSWSVKNGQLLLHKKGKVLARWNPSVYNNPNLMGNWQLGYISGLNKPFAELYGGENCPTIMITTDQKKATGYSGCHEYEAGLLINEHSIFFNDVTQCDTSCQINEDNVFLQTLQEVNAYVFKDDKTLVLIRDDQPVMALTRKKLLKSPVAVSKQ